MALASLDMSQIVEESKHFNFTELALKYGVHRSTIARRLAKLNNTPIIVTSQEGPEIPVEQAEDTGITMDSAREAIANLFGNEAPPPAAPHRELGEMKKILLLNDIHIPYHHEEALQWAISENKDADLVIVGGDLLDNFSTSRYTKYQQRYSPTEEFRFGRAFMEQLNTTFHDVWILPGNHDERWKKHLIRLGMSPSDLEAMNYLGALASGNPKTDITNCLYCMCQGLENLTMMEPITLDFAEFAFMAQVGDLVISHAEKFSRIPGKAADQASMWMRSFAMQSDPPVLKPFRVVAQCHTHQASMHWGDAGWNFECGCLCKVPDYAGQPKLMGAQRPSVLAYTVFYQDKNGRTDMRLSRIVPYRG